MDPGEWALRVELAACYRLFAYLGWTEMIFNHITARVPGPGPHFLTSPFGLHSTEVTAANLVKIDLDGAGFDIHSALHAAVPAAHCIMHTQTTAGMAVACSKHGLSPTNRYAASVLPSVAYHDFEGSSRHDDERARLVTDLGDKRVLILRNRGLLVHGPSIPEAFLVMLKVEAACRAQVSTFTIDGGYRITDEVLAVSYDVDDPSAARGARRIFEAMVRQADRAKTCASPSPSSL